MDEFIESLSPSNGSPLTMCTWCSDIQPDKNGKDDRASSLAVRDLDMLAEENGSEHHTSLYAAVQSGIAVLRRGFAFRLKLTLNREYDPEKDVICLIFTLKGEYKDTLIVDDLFGERSIQICRSCC
ncbi:F13A1 [Cordylochernes scorpioides]|uniref:F13A1 n=1 Tax=Cordylochernes scorpioides TaxID=51811 RepID=A0ABY6LXY7_9ARAC|nr:F13A1 [Cordylochernes scorpioides]